MTLIRMLLTIMIIMFFLMSLAIAQTLNPGTQGTVTSWDVDKRAIVVTPCNKKSDGEYDYVACGKVVREKTTTALCKRGKGNYNWKLQIGKEKSMLVQKTSCK